MRRVLIGNFKGGVGKTTTAATVGVALARRGHQVVLIDADPQASLSLMFNAGGQGGPDLYSVTMRGAPVETALVEVEPRLAVVPGCDDMGAVEGLLYRRVARERVFERTLAPIKADFVLMDIAPTFNLLSVAAVVWCSEIWAPVMLDYLSIMALKHFGRVVAEVEEGMPTRAPLRLIVPQLADMRLTSSIEVLGALRAVYAPEVIAQPIRRSVRAAEAASHGKTIFDFAPGNPVADEYLQLAEKIAIMKGMDPDEQKS